MENHLNISKLKLINFKNYQQVDVLFSPSINCLIGKNGAGKTNVLDAIHYLSMSKSYMNPIDSQNILFNSPFFVIQSTWNKENKEDNIYCGIKRGQKKVVKKNNTSYDKLADHIGQFPTVMISPYDRNLITEGSSGRRKWIDGIISQFDRTFLNGSIQYNKVLQQRNALLKNNASNGFFDVESIGVWDEQLIECGVPIFEKRKKSLEEFTPIFNEYYSLISGGSEEVQLEYKSQLFDASFKTLIAEARKQDWRRQFTTVGVHKDDLIFKIKGYPIKKFGSQGQQKSFLIALKLAQYEWLFQRLNIKPVLLLDDIFDKLDHYRVERLMQMVNDHAFGQVIITDTDEERIATIFKKNNIAYSSFKVNDNTIQPLKHEIA